MTPRQENPVRKLLFSLVPGSSAIQGAADQRRRRPLDVEGSVSYDGGEWQYGVSIHEFRDNLVIHETIYGTPGWEAPAWRAPWRESS